MVTAEPPTEVLPENSQQCPVPLTQTVCAGEAGKSTDDLWVFYFECPKVSLFLSTVVSPVFVPAMPSIYLISL